MSRLLAICIWVIAVAVIVFMAGSGWWLPEAVSAHRDLIDRQFKLTMIVIGAGFLLTQAAPEAIAAPGLRRAIRERSWSGRW